MQEITKPARRVVPEYVILYEQNRRIQEILEPHRRQLEQGMTPEEILMPLLKRWQSAYEKQGIFLSTTDVLIFLMRSTYRDLLKMEAGQ